MSKFSTDIVLTLRRIALAVLLCLVFSSCGKVVVGEAKLNGGGGDAVMPGGGGDFVFAENYVRYGAGMVLSSTAKGRDITTALDGLSEPDIARDLMVNAPPKLLPLLKTVKIVFVDSLPQLDDGQGHKLDIEASYDESGIVYVLKSVVAPKTAASYAHAVALVIHELFHLANLVADFEDSRSAIHDWGRRFLNGTIMVLTERILQGLSGNQNDAFQGWGGVSISKKGNVETLLSIRALGDDGILAIGMGTHNDANRCFILKRNADGSPDRSFGIGGRVDFDLPTGVSNEICYDILFTRNKYFVVGSQWTTATANAVIIAVNLNGSLDTEFRNNGRYIMSYQGLPFLGNSFVELDENRWAVAGQYYYNGFWRMGGVIAEPGKPVVILNTKAATAINSRASVATSIAVAGDGKIYLEGYRLSSTNKMQVMIAAFRPNGNLDLTFNETGFFPIEGEGSSGFLKLARNGTLLVPATITTGLVSTGAVFNVTTDGNLNTRFGSNGTAVLAGFDASNVTSLEVMPNGKFYAGGSCRTGVTSSCVARFNKDGSLDKTFNPLGEKPGVALSNFGNGFAGFRTMAITSYGIVGAGNLRTPDSTDIVAFGLVSFLGNIPF